MGDKITRMNNPEDTLRKCQLAFSGNTFHKYHHLPGKYITPSTNELPAFDNSQKRNDGCYCAKLSGNIIIINPEDESTRVGEDELNKSFGYKRTLKYAFKDNDIYSAITTPLPIDKCTKSISIPYNIRYCPHLISYTSHFDGEKILNTMTNQIMNKEIALNNVDAMNLAMIPRMFSENQDIILEKCCKLFKYANLKMKILKWN